ncbi:MAG: hypothetical protein HYU27_02570, partial [Acidobacteria bacterium]|nr:hypothetical protein [Acidobacteriota bacterium]
ELNHGTQEQIWSQIQKKYLWIVSPDPEQVSYKPALQRWLARQEAIPSPAGVEVFNKKRKAKVGLPNFQEMLKIYGTAAGLEEGKWGRRLRDKRLSSEDLEREAVRLARLGKNHPETIQALREVLGDHGIPPRNRSAAAWGLAMRGDPKEVKTLAGALDWIAGDVPKLVRENPRARVKMAKALSLLAYTKIKDVELALAAVWTAYREIGRLPSSRKKRRLLADLRKSRDGLVGHLERLHLERLFYKKKGKKTSPALEALIRTTAELNYPDWSLRFRLIQETHKARKPERRAWVVEQLMQKKDPFAIPVLVNYLRASFGEKKPAAENLTTQIDAVGELFGARNSWLRRLPENSAVRQRMLKKVDGFVREHLSVSRIRNPFLRLAVADRWAGLEERPEAVDVRSYEEIGRGAQAVVYKRPQGDVVKVFKPLEKNKVSVERYVKVVNGLPETLEGIKIPRVKMVEVQRATAGSRYGVQTDFVDGATVRRILWDFEARDPGDGKREKALEQERRALVQLKVRISQFLDEVDKQTDGLADRHWESGDDMVFDLESTLSNFMVPRRFLIEDRKGGTRLNRRLLGKIAVVCVDPINIVTLDDRPSRARTDSAAEGFDPLEEGSAGLEEGAAAMERIGRWLAGYRRADSGSRRLVLGASVARALPLQILAGLQERMVVDRGDMTRVVTDLVAQDARSALFYGGLEEFQLFKPMAEAAGIKAGLRSVKDPGAGDELAQMISQLLLELGYSPEAVAAGLEEMTRDLILLGEKA